MSAVLSVSQSSTRSSNHLPHSVDAADNSSCTYSVSSAPSTSQTDFTWPTLYPRQQINDDMAVSYSYGPEGASASLKTDSLEVYTPFVYGGIYKQDDPVGQYLAQQVIMRNLTTTHAGHAMQSQQSRGICDSYAHINTSLEIFRRFPDPEHIRHLHTLHSLLPHIQLERKLNALSGPELNIVDGRNGNILCRAVPKKLLVLFMGREVVRKFLHTIEREDNKHWRGPPTRQHLVLPYGSQAAVKIVVSWMTRACKFTTMNTMKPPRIPNNLFAACSLAQTLEVLNLHKDAYRVDSAISQHFFKRPIYPVEVETLWNCLGENSKYVYGCIKAFDEQLRRKMGPDVTEDLQRLRTRHPQLHARIHDSALNKTHQPIFGRQWFANMEYREGSNNVKVLDDDCLQATASNTDDPTPRVEPLSSYVTQAPATLSPVGRAGSSQTSSLHTPNVRALNASAPAFQPMGTQLLKQPATL